MPAAIRIDVHLGYFFGLVEDGTVTLDALTEKVQQAVIAAIDEAAEHPQSAALVQRSDQLEGRPPLRGPHTLGDMLDAEKSDPRPEALYETAHYTHGARRVRIDYDFS